jgi:hypothetical protein
VSDNNINPPPPSDAIQGERHVSEVAGRSGGIGRKAGVGVIVAGAALACGVILLTSQKPDLKPQEGPQLAVRPAIRYEPPPPPPVQPVIMPVPQQPPPLPEQQPFMPSQTQAAPQRQQRLLVYTSGDNSAGPSEPGSGLMSPNPNDVPMAGAAGLPGYYGAPGFPGDVPSLPGGAGGQGGRGRASGSPTTNPAHRRHGQRAAEPALPPDNRNPDPVCPANRDGFDVSGLRYLRHPARHFRQDGSDAA